MNENNNTEPVVYAVGTRGYSAYEVAVQNGFIGTEQEWLDSLVGPQGDLGPEGKSAYQVAVDNGYTGTEEQWVNDFLTPYGYYDKDEIDNLISGQLKQTDIVDNLESDSDTKVLSAKQGKILKANIDENASDIEKNAEDISLEITDRQAGDSHLQTQIDSLGSGSPIPASSTSDMTDTTKLYVNTTDGYVYYYENNDWQQGWLYQAAEDSDTVNLLNHKVGEISETDYTVIDKSNEILTQYGTSGYIDLDTGGFTALSGYKVYYFTAIENGYVWFDETDIFTRIGVYGEELFDTNDVVFVGGNTRNNLPDEDNKLEIKSGMIVAVCIETSSSKNFSLHIPTRIILSEDQIDYIDEVYDITNKVSKNGTDEVTMQNSDYINVIYENIFDGNYLDGYALAGSGQFTFQSVANRYHMVVVPVKSNTVYTILATPNSDTSNFFKYATATKKLADGENLDGAVSHSISSRKGNFIQTITTGANDKYLYCYGIDSNNADTSQFYQICEGEIETFTTDQYNVYYGVFTNKIKLPTDVLQRNIKIQKTDSTHFKVYVPSHNGEKVVRYDFVKYLKTWDSLEYVDGNGQTQVATNIQSSNCWNNDHIYDGKGNYIAQGNSNFITKPTGSRYHVGNGHGNEVMLYFAFLADGVDIDIDNMTNGEIKECSNFRFVLKSNIYKCSNIGEANTYDATSPALDTTGNPIVNFIHYMEMNFNIGNDIEINNRLLVEQNNITFEQCHGAMLQCYFGDFSNVICNNSESTRNIIDSNGIVTVPTGNDINFRNSNSQKCNFVEMYGGDFYIRQNMIQDDSSRENKSRVYFNFYNDRLKCYFQPVIASYGKQAGETIETFNAGDVISVTAHRRIELNYSQNND